MQRYSKFLVCFEEFRINLFNILWAVLDLWRRIIGDGLEVDRRIVDHRPPWLSHLYPVPERAETPLRKPRRLMLFGRNESNDIFTKARRDRFLLYFGNETVLIVLIYKEFTVLGTAH